MEGRIGVDKVFAEGALRKCGPAPAAGGPSTIPTTTEWGTETRSRYENRYPPIAPRRPVSSGCSSEEEGTMAAVSADRKVRRCS